MEKYKDDEIAYKTPETPTPLSSPSYHKTANSVRFQSLLSKVGESGRKLAVIASLPDENDLISLALQDYVAIIVELLDNVNLVCNQLSDSSLAVPGPYLPLISRLSKLISTNLQEINSKLQTQTPGVETDIRCLYETANEVVNLIQNLVLTSKKIETRPASLLVKTKGNGDNLESFPTSRNSPQIQSRISSPISEEYQSVQNHPRHSGRHGSLFSSSAKSSSTSFSNSIDISTKIHRNNRGRHSRAQTAPSSAPPAASVSADEISTFLLDSKTRAHNLRLKFAETCRRQFQKGFESVLADLDQIDMFYTEQYRHHQHLLANNIRINRLSQHKQERSDDKETIRRLKGELADLHEKMRLLMIKNCVTTSNLSSANIKDYAEQARELASPDLNPQNSGSSNLGDDMAVLERGEIEGAAVNYNDAFTPTSMKSSSEEAILKAQSDQDAQTVENLLSAIEARQLLSDSQNELLQPSTKQETITRQQSVPNFSTTTDHLPKLDSINNDNLLLKNVAATHIQRCYRGFISRKAYRNAILRRHIAREILETEVSYVKGILVLYKQYVIPLRFKAVRNEAIIPKDQIEILFFHIREIMAFNHMLLGKIESRVVKWNVDRKLGDIFIESAPNLEMYTHYVNNYNRALDIYEEWSNTSAFKAFIQSVRSKQEKRSLGLLDLLITPIQRIPRYVLLLKELLKRTPRNHPDFHDLFLAISKLQYIADIINERKRESERYTELLKIQTRISGCPIQLAPSNLNSDSTTYLNDPSDEIGRRCLMEGDLLEITEHGKKKSRHVFLFTDILICTQTHKNSRFTSSTSLCDYKWHIGINDSQIGQIERVYESRQSNIHEETGQEGNIDAPVNVSHVVAPDRIDDDIPPFAIGIKTQNKKVLLVASDQLDLEKWLQSISDARMYTNHQMNRINLRRNSADILSKFVVKRVEIASLTELLNVQTNNSILDLLSARRAIREAIDAVESEIRAEARVLYGIQRTSSRSQRSNSIFKANNSNQQQQLLQRRRSSDTTKNNEPLSKQVKLESTQILHTLQLEIERLNEIQMLFESENVTGKPIGNDIYIDKASFDKLISHSNAAAESGVSMGGGYVKLYEIQPETEIK